MSDAVLVPPTEANSTAEHERTLLDFAVAQSRAIFYVADLDGDRPLRFISSNIETITGHKVADFLGEAYFGRDLLHEDDRENYDQNIDQLRTTKLLSQDYRLRTTSGFYLWFRDEIRLTEHPTTGRAEFVGCMIDVTAEKRSELQLRDAEAQKAAIVEAAQDAIVVIDTDGCVVEFNPTAERIFGHRRADVLGKDMTDLLVPPHLRAAHAAGLTRARERNADVAQDGRMESEAMRADGSTFPMELSFAKTTSNGKTIFVGEIRDLSEQRAIEADRQRLAQLLEDAISSLPIGFALIDANQKLVMCNSEFCIPYGLSTEDMIGMHLAEAVRLTAADLARLNGVPVEGTPDEITEQLKHYSFEAKGPFEMQMNDGEWWLVSSSPIAEGGRVIIGINNTERKTAELALSESEQHFRRMVESHPMAMWVVDVSDGDVLYHSPAAAEMFGLEWPAIAPFPITDCYARPLDRKPYVETLRRQGEVRDYELLCRRSDGTTFWVAVNARLLMHEGREVSVTSLTDLSEHKQCEAELRHAREVIEDAIESLSEGFALFDANDQLVMCNERYRDYSNQSADLLVPGVRWQDFIRTGAERGQYVDAVGRIDEWLEATSLARSAGRGSREFQQSDGRWFVASIQRTREGGTVVVRTEITDRKRMEQALRDSEAMVRRVLESCPVPISMTRAEDGSVIYGSPELMSLVGLERHEIPNSATKFFADSGVRDDYIARLRRDGEVAGYEMKLNKVDGSEFWASVSARLIEFQGEEVVVACPFDLTERRAIEAEMQRQRDALHQSEKLSALGELLAGIAHELNNPLSVVVGQSLLLKETTKDSAISDRATKIGNAADRCARIVKTFLAMARERPTETRPTSLNTVVEEALEISGYALRSANIDVRLRLTNTLPNVSGDGDQLCQVLTNLILNAQQALKDHPEPRTLKISTSHRPQRGEVAIKIKDNGPGIPEPIRSRIFEPFFTTKEIGTGTGIGLAFCHRIIDTHGGRIKVEASPDGGACFVIALPVGAASSDTDLVEEDKAIEAEAIRVLVVEDEEDVANTMADILGALGHQAEIASSGLDALDRIAARDFGLILSDMRMPGMDGPEFYRQLCETRPDLAARLAFVTGDTMSSRIRSYLEKTGRPHLEKPVTPDEVRELLTIMEAPTETERDGSA
ncbi:MAG: PAS domain S-box protein [Rhodospirillaceae bacterium]|nr:PAS domain S-box protein [Rhodospirillaceae bacterium]